jgi:L-iditol 2-dehydrogenase
MKAWVLHGIGDLRFEDVPVPKIKAGEVLIKVKAAGICSSDVPRVFSSGAYHYPIILGHEFSGAVERVHDEKDAGLIGGRVGVFPLIPCFSCESCADGRYETCSDYGYIGSRQNGAFAEYAAVPARNIISLPDDMTFEQAALLEPAAVALHAVKTIDFANVHSAAVVGSGTIGRLITKWLELKGMSDISLIDKNDSPDEADVYFEAVGNITSFTACVENVKANGWIISVGNPNIDFKIEQKLYWQILRKQISIKGTWNSNYPSDWRKVIEHADSLRLDDFISHKFDFNELGKAFDMLYNKRERHGKVIIML